MYKCKYCNKECKNENSLRNHERLCKQNPDRQLTPYERGIKTFEMSGRVKTSSNPSGSAIKTNEFTKQCPYCGRWFKPSQMGGHIAWCDKIPSNGDKFAQVGTIILSNITVSQLNSYRETHLVCEICGRSVSEVVKYQGKFSSKNLCVDHDHQTGLFRGLLCQACNRQLGWYEKNKDSITEYLNRELDMK